MAYSTYTITLTDGTVLAYVNPQTVDNSSSALTLVGQADLGYGVPLNENLVHLLENFANNAPPNNANGALQGQLWFDSTNNLLKLYDVSSTWNPIATQAWVEENFASSGSSNLYTTESWVESYVSAQDFVTETYLESQNYLNSNQTITLTGDVTGTGSTAIATTLGANGVTAGTYEKVTVDVAGRVTVGAQLNQQDIVTALGYTPASVGSGPGQSLYSYGALSSTSGTVLNYLGFQSTNSNTNTLQLSEYRFAAGNDWTTATTRIQQITDTTSQGYIDFNPQDHENCTAIGANNVVQLVAATDGIYANNHLSVVTTSSADPVIQLETGSLNSQNTGFATNAALGIIGYSQANNALYISANADGSNNIAVLKDGSMNAIGFNSVSSNGLFLKTNNGNNSLNIGTDGGITQFVNGIALSSISNAGAIYTKSTITSLGSMYNLNGNWNTNTDGNTYFLVNSSNASNSAALWFDIGTVPHAWRMVANPGVGGASNKWSVDANGAMTSTTVNVANFSGYLTGMSNQGTQPSGNDNLSFNNSAQRRIRIDGRYDFTANGGNGADTLTPGYINFWHGESNLGDGNPTNNTGDRRRFSMEGNGNCTIYTLTDQALWSADTAGSDIRLKQNVKNYSGGLDFVNQVRPVTFEWKEGTDLHKKHGNVKNFGFIAQELEEISGHNAVTKHGPKDYRIVHKQALVPHLVSAVQELSTENAYLKLALQKMEDRLRMLEQIVSQK